MSLLKEPNQPAQNRKLMYIAENVEYVFVYRITEEVVGDEKEQKESEEIKKVPSPPQRSESQDAIPIKLS